jgi:hypothetical protein
MASTYGMTGLPLPTGSDAPNLPSYMASLLASADAHFVQTVDDVADRDTRLAGAPSGTLAVLKSTGTTWARVGTSWVTIYEAPEAWRPPESIISGYFEQTPIRFRRIGQQVFMQGRLGATSGAFPRNGTQIMQVPADCIPNAYASMAVAISLAGSNDNATGRIEVVPIDGTTSFGPPGALLLFISLASTDVPWVAIDGSYWLDSPVLGA